MNNINELKCQDIIEDYDKCCDVIDSHALHRKRIVDMDVCVKNNTTSLIQNDDIPLVFVNILFMSINMYYLKYY